MAYAPLVTLPDSCNHQNASTRKVFSVAVLSIQESYFSIGYFLGLTKDNYGLFNNKFLLKRLLIDFLFKTIPICCYQALKFHA